MQRDLDPSPAHNLHCSHSLRISKSKKCGWLVERMKFWRRGEGGGWSPAVPESSCAPCAAAGKIDVGARYGIDGCLMQIDPPSVRPSGRKRKLR